MTQAKTNKLLTKQDVLDNTIAKCRKESVALQGTIASKNIPETKTGGDTHTMPGGQFTDDGFVLDVDQEDYDKAGSKFALPGLHISEMGMPEWETPGKSIKFPFTIVEDGVDKDKKGKIVCGISKEALWKLKETLTAVGEEVKTTPEGKISFNHMAIAGKRFKSLWTKQKDSRSVEEGGKGTEYTKPTAAYPLDTTEEDLGI